LQLCIGDSAHHVKEVDSKKTALLLIEMQNEFISPGGKLYDSIKSELYRTSVVEKTVTLAKEARKAGALVFHIPLIVNQKGSYHSSKIRGLLKDCHEKKLFAKDTWNADIINEHKPWESDRVVKGKNSLDSFSGSNLQELLKENGIKTIILGGLLANCCVESTMRSAYEKGYNVITLTDGTACTSKVQHLATIKGTFRMFSTPMSCQQAAIKLIQKTSATRTDFPPPTELSANSQPRISLSEFATLVLTRQHEEDNSSDPMVTMEEARKDMNSRYKTTQVFISPIGDWTQQVAKEISGRKQLRSCWVRGPYTSPFSIASNFNNLILVASGIGITPALGVMGQYSGSSRSKFLVWMTSCPYMLKYFAPLLNDSHVAVLFYTGNDYTLSVEELAVLRSYGNIYIELGRPKDITAVIKSLIETYETQSYKFMQDASGEMSQTHTLSQITIDSMDEESLRGWCMLYCGGSLTIEHIIRGYANEKGITFNCEMFDW